MRVIGFEFSGASESPVRAGYLGLEDVTVLIGPNDSGKSSVLGLLARALLVTTPPAWRPSMSAALPTADSMIVFAEGTEGDRDLLLALVADPTYDPAPDSSLDDRDASSGSVAGYMWPRAELRGGVVQCEIELVDRFGEPEGQMLMEALQATRLFAFEVQDADPPGWIVYWCLPQSHVLADVAGRSPVDDWPGERDGPVPLWTLGKTRLQVLPRPVLAPVGMETPRAELEEYVGRVATLVRIGDVTDDIYDDALTTGYDDHDSWVIGSHRGLAVAIDPLVDAILASAEAAAAARLPSFVRQAYTLRLRIRPILSWGADGRIAIELEPHGEPQRSFPADRAAAGLRTWIEIALLEAVSLLASWAAVAEFLIGPSHEWDLVDVEPPSEVKRVVEVLRSEGLIAEPLMLFRERGCAETLAESAFANLTRHSQMDPDDVATTLRRYLYLVDEPERHLQPGLQRLAARWLDETFREIESQAVIATHAPAFLNATSNPHVVRVNRALPEDALTTIDVAAITATDSLATELGFDRGELLAGVSTILYVEGAVDREVLDALLADELRAARIVVSAFGGTYNITEVLHDPLLTYTTARVTVLVDNLTTEQIRKLREDVAYRKRSADRGRIEADWIARLLNAAEAAGRQVAVFGLTVRDVFFLLDDQGLRAVSRLWPGHEEAWKQWQGHRKQNRLRENQWKDFFAERFEVSVNSATARKAGNNMRERGATPEQLRKLLIDIEMLGLERLG
jgi:hypothetical protein